MAKITVSVPDDMLDSVRRLAERSGTNVSALAARGLRDQLVAEALANHDRRQGMYPELAPLRRIRDEYAADQLTKFRHAS